MIHFLKGSLSTNSIVNSQWLKQNLKKVKLIDASYVPTPKRNPEEFKTKYFGDFELLQKETPFSPFTAEHIPGAVHFSLDVAYFPSKFIKFDLYPPEVFQKYIQLLGVNENDHVVIYSRGPAAGMLFASRAYWTFKTYGFTNVSLLNGGLDTWKSAGGPTEQKVTLPRAGNFTSKSIDTSNLAKFEEIPFDKISSNDENIVYLDSRITPQFTGEEPLNELFPGTTATGSHVTGAISFPMVKVIGPNGFKSEEECEDEILKIGLKPGNENRQVFIACNLGIQASVIFVALERAGIKSKVYNGSMTEMAYRAPQLVNALGDK